MQSTPHPWAESLSELHAQAWARLQRGVHDRHAAARHLTLATVSPAGLPQARTVVLRATDKANASLDVHTDLSSPKVTELRANPAALVHVWDSRARLQLRLEARASILTGEAVAAVWARVPEASRSSYGCTPAPGAPLPEALAYRREPDSEAFAVLRLTVDAMDILHLGEHHRRARFCRSTDWSGQWLAP